eukprot:TRINITY_DN1_c1_g2_i1.p1 TRINITY_DN1_c1_g2~~TRINITY_DN1_c1_g2_i1.p1  ORF type:complete len:288 (+),score=163.29 TRINITY_DN1_c1_g2_i1:100-963(+)
MAQLRQERNQDATIYISNLDTKVDEALLWELMLQAGPVVNVHIPRDKLNQEHSGYGFVEFHSEEDAEYAMKIMNMIMLFGKPIRINKASRERTFDIGANIFVGNLDPDVDEKLLHDTFGAFGVIFSTPKIMRDPGTGVSKGYAFISYASFEAADAAIENMNGQYLCNRPLRVSYALKKDGKGERHGSAAERLLAANNPNAIRARPNTMFANVTAGLSAFAGGPIPSMGSIPIPPPMGSIPPPVIPTMGSIPPPIGSVYAPAPISFMAPQRPPPMGMPLVPPYIPPQK